MGPKSRRELKKNKLFFTGNSPRTRFSYSSSFHAGNLSARERTITLLTGDIRGDKLRREGGKYPYRDVSQLGAVKVSKTWALFYILAGNDHCCLQVLFIFPFLDFVVIKA